MSTDKKIPRSAEDDYSDEIVGARQAFISEKTGTELNHTKQFSFDPHDMDGNIENLWGVAQIPIGIAGPLLVNGEHAQGGKLQPRHERDSRKRRGYHNGLCGINAAGADVYLR